jgi:hypothetical protein
MMRVDGTTSGRGGWSTASRSGPGWAGQARPATCRLPLGRAKAGWPGRRVWPGQSWRFRGCAAPGRGSRSLLFQGQAQRELGVSVALAAGCGLVLRHRIRGLWVGDAVGLGGVGAERLDLEARVAAAQFGVGGDRHGARCLGERFPLAPGLLDSSEHLRASNGGTGTINGLIELHRRIARGFRNRANHRLRMLLIGGLDQPTRSKKSQKCHPVRGFPEPGTAPL